MLTRATMRMTKLVLDKMAKLEGFTKMILEDFSELTRERCGLVAFVRPWRWLAGLHADETRFSNYACTHVTFYLGKDISM